MSFFDDVNKTFSTTLYNNYSNEIVGVTAKNQDDKTKDVKQVDKIKENEEEPVL